MTVCLCLSLPQPLTHVRQIVGPQRSLSLHFHSLNDHSLSLSLSLYLSIPLEHHGSSFIPFTLREEVCCWHASECRRQLTSYRIVWATRRRRGFSCPLFFNAPPPWQIRILLSAELLMKACHFKIIHLGIYTSLSLSFSICINIHICIHIRSPIRIDIFARVENSNSNAGET